MAPANLKGVCLAAGFGSRLMPLTLHMPKAEVPVLGVPSLYYALWQLEQFGLKEVAINTHHQAAATAKLAANFPGNQLQIKMSHEEKILGSGGAYGPLQTWRQDSPLLVYNPDIISNIDLAGVFRTFEDEEVVATLALIPTPPTGSVASVHTVGDEIVGFGSQYQGECERSYYGAAIFVLGDPFFDFLPNGASGLIDTLLAAMKAGHRVNYYLHEDYWIDIGNSHSFLWQAQQDLLTNKKLRQSIGLDNLVKKLNLDFEFIDQSNHPQFHGPTFVSKSARIDPKAQFYGCNVIMPGAKISGAGRLENLMIFGNAKVDADEDPRDQILFKHLELSTHVKAID